MAFDRIDLDRSHLVEFRMGADTNVFLGLPHIQHIGASLGESTTVSLLKRFRFEV